MPRVLRVLCAAALVREKLRRTAPSVRAAARLRDAFYRQAWQEAAEQCGASVRDLGDNLLEIEWGGARRYVTRNYTPLDDPVTLRVAGHKGIVLEKLAAAGLPVPRHLSFSLAEMDTACRFLKTLNAPGVVKTLSGGSAGRGVVTGVRTHRDLKGAVIAVAGLGNRLLLEEQIEGDNIRLLYLDGELLDAVQRNPPAVTGDGRSSIRELIAEQNRRRLREGVGLAQVQLAMDSDVDATLRRQGLSLRAVPPEGRVVAVKTVVNDNRATENTAVRERIGDALVAQGRRAAEAIGVRLAGVDVITPDPTTSLDDNGGKILEVNTTPGLYLHYNRVGDPVRVAEPILRAMFGSKTS